MAVVVVSTILTLKFVVVLLPWMSVATTVTGDVPTGKPLPVTGFATMVATWQLSVATSVT